MRGPLPVVLLVAVSLMLGFFAAQVPGPQPAPAPRTETRAPAVPAQTAQAPAAPRPAARGDTAGQRAVPPATTGQQRPAAPQPPAQATPAPSGSRPAPAAHTAGHAAHTAGDPEAGRAVYQKCQACHSLEPGKQRLGPSLAGLFGRKAGEVQGFNYSPAMRRANVTWSPETLDEFLADPQKMVPGNRMPFPGIKTENARKDVVAYISSATSAEVAAGPRTIAPSQAAARSFISAAAQPVPSGYIPEARFTLRTGIAEGRMVYIGEGGDIDGQINPILKAIAGQLVQLTLINGEGAEHDIVFPEHDAKSPRVVSKRASTTIAFVAGKAGDFTYYCGVPGHRQAGMEGQFIVTPGKVGVETVEADISHNPAELPPPLPRRAPQAVSLHLETVELEGRLAEGSTYGYWTFNGKVPGPFVRVRVGDTVEVSLRNPRDSEVTHSVDFHAATGPGGGAASLQVEPGGEKSMKFKALTPGIYVYHCATPMVAHHIASGMYGLILVEPENGLPPVDHEFYVMQGEIYTDAPLGQQGSHEFSVEKLLNERPEYFVFNGAVGALTKFHPLRAKVGETVRIYFGVGGPNFTSSFHVIGEIFDRVYNYGSLISPPVEGIQTATVPAGGAVVAEFKVDVPGSYTIVDHALARAERGLVGVLLVEGEPNPEIYDGEIGPGSGH